MSITKVSDENKKMVLFLILPTLDHKMRMGISLGLILVAFFVQFQLNQTMVGVCLLACGNLLLLVKGYDNRVKFEGYHPEAEWTRVEMQTILDLKKTEQRMKKWDQDFFDISNMSGLFILCLAILFMAAVYFALLQMQGTESLQILMVDAGILLLPHWFTGLRRITNVLSSGLTMKIDEIKNILDRSNNQIKQHEAHYYMLLKGDSVKIPKDVKFRVDIANAPEDFLGLYGQVVLNDVQGRKYPYFYCVLVAKKGNLNLSKLKDLNTQEKKQDNEGFLNKFINIAKMEDKIITEFKLQGDVQVLVVRQFTTKKSGYHTKPEMEDSVLRLSLTMAESLSGSLKGAY